MDETDSNKPTLLHTSSQFIQSMKKKIFIISFILLATCLLFVVLRSKNETQNNFQTNKSMPTNQIVEPLHQSTNILQPHAKTGEEELSQIRSNLLFPSSERKKRIEQSLEAWRTPIEFYGMVVDESNNPVADADITFD